MEALEAKLSDMHDLIKTAALGEARPSLEHRRAAPLDSSSARAMSHRTPTRRRSSTARGTSRHHGVDDAGIILMLPAAPINLKGGRPGGTVNHHSRWPQRHYKSVIAVTVGLGIFGD